MELHRAGGAHRPVHLPAIVAGTPRDHRVHHVARPHHQRAPASQVHAHHAIGRLLVGGIEEAPAARAVLHGHDRVVEGADRRWALGCEVGAGGDQRRVRRHALTAQQRHQQRGHVLAVAPAARTHLVGGVRLERADVAVHGHVAHLVAHPAEQPLFGRLARQPRRLRLDGHPRGQAQLRQGRHQAAVPHAHVLPARHRLCVRGAHAEV